jgi:hypothetical protein
MNIDRLRHLARALENLPPHGPQFGMGRYAVERGVPNPPNTPLGEIGCNTVLCLAGLTCHLNRSLVDLTKNYDSRIFYWAHAKDILGLTTTEADRLFVSCFPWGLQPGQRVGDEIDLDSITPEQAVAELRRLADAEEDRLAALIYAENPETLHHPAPSAETVEL